MKTDCTNYQVKTLVYRFNDLMMGLRDQNDLEIKHAAMGLKDMQTQTGVYVFPQSELENFIVNRGVTRCLRKHIE